MVVVLHLESEKESGGVSVSRFKIPTCRAGDSEIPRKLAESTNADSTLVADALAADIALPLALLPKDTVKAERCSFHFLTVDHMWSRS